MTTAQSLGRLQAMVLVSQQLPHHEADQLLRAAVDDPQVFFAEVLDAHSTGHVHLPKHLVRLLERDLHWSRRLAS